MGISNIQISDCEKYLLYSLDNKGNRKYNLYVKEIYENKSYVIKKNITSNAIWGRNSKEVFFTDMEKNTLRQNKIYVYNIDKRKKRLLYEETDEEFYAYISKSKSKRFAFIISLGRQSTEYKYIDLYKKYIKINIFKKRKDNIKYYLEHVQNYFYYKSNEEAKN